MSRTLRAVALLGTALALVACSTTHADRLRQPTTRSLTASTSPSSTAALATTSRHPSSSVSPVTPTPPPPVRRADKQLLPLRYSTRDSQQVITVVATSPSSTSATLQAWRRTTHGWSTVGASVLAWLGTAGMTAQPSEQVSATPEGSFTVTQAFGRNPDPGTALPYRQTTPADWWISQSGPLYNTLQHCSASCPFAQGSPNEHLYDELPYYEFAVVIDYNRSPVTQGAGSAFFLHVTVGAPTQGCVSIERAQLVRIMRWLRPSEHPRILIGTG